MSGKLSTRTAAPHKRFILKSDGLIVIQIRLCYYTWNNLKCNLPYLLKIEEEFRLPGFEKILLTTMGVINANWKFWEGSVCILGFFLAHADVGQCSHVKTLRA